MYVMDNTVGSSRRVRQTSLAYIAGFLDGDGCIKAGIEKRSNNIFGYRTRILVSFTQTTRNRRVLDWIFSELKMGTITDYPSKGVSEYVIYDSKFIERLLRALKPYVVNKYRQLYLALEFLKLSDRYKNGISFNKAIKIAKDIRALNNYPKRISL